MGLSCGRQVLTESVKWDTKINLVTTLDFIFDYESCMINATDSSVLSNEDLFITAPAPLFIRHVYQTVDKNIQ